MGNVCDGFRQLPVAAQVFVPLFPQDPKLRVDGGCQLAQVGIPGGNVDESIGIRRQFGLKGFPNFQSSFVHHIDFPQQGNNHGYQNGNDSQQQMFHNNLLLYVFLFENTDSSHGEQSGQGHSADRIPPVKG